jgi:putative FmdB family regulatory protein
MPLYSYRCARCGAARDEIRSMVDRDAPLACTTREVTKLRLDAVSMTASGPELDGVIQGARACPGPMVREEISETARMANAWKP